MAFTHITPADLSGKGVVGLPDTPQLSALAMQQKFDEITTDVIVPKFNALADELDNGAGAIMNVTDPTSGTTDTLQNALDHIETENALNTADRHNHANKATLDDIDATVKAAYDRLVTLLGAITGIQSVLSSSTAELPDAKAVADAIATVQTEVSLNTAARHTHVNKATLDDITALVKQGYDDLVTLLTGIAGIETTLTNSNDKIPRSDAVYTAVDSLSAIVAANTAARHTHTNKATLDAIDATTKTAYDGLVTLFTGITSVSSSVTDDTVSIPNGHAIVDYVSALGGGDMLKATYDTNDDGTVDSADYATNAGHATTADSATTAGSATTADSATTAGYANSAGDATKLGGLNSSAYAATTDLQKLFGDVATYQATSVALRNYAVGDFMIYENNFYEVTTAIASGGTIVKGAGGNITQRTVGEVLARLGLTMTGATSLLAGDKGLVPAPSAGDEDKYLKGDGTWGAVASTPTAADVSYDNTQSGMVATNAQDAIDELNADINKGYVEVTTDGVKTMSQLLDSLYALLDGTKVTGNSFISFNNRIYRFSQEYQGYWFIVTTMSSINVTHDLLYVKSSGSTFEEIYCPVGGATGYHNQSSNVQPSGRKITLYY